MENNKNVKELNLEEMDQVSGGRIVCGILDVNEKKLSLREMGQVYGGNDVHEGMNMMAGKNVNRRRKNP